MPLILDSPPPEELPDLQEERRNDHHEADVVVVGAGILGCAISITLARQGRSVVLLEKSLKQPDRIVGELLQPGGVKALEILGLADCLEGIDAIPVRGYQIVYHGDPVAIPYPANAASVSTLDPHDSSKTSAGTLRGKRPEGRSFHHGRLIQNLRQRALRTPNISVVETEAKELVKNGWTGQILGVKCKTRKEDDYYFAAQTIVSDGYASTFRKAHHPHSPVSKSKFYALELLDCPLPAPEHGHVILGTHAPILLYQIGEHETRALIDVPTSTPAASTANGGVKGYLRNVVLPSLPPKVQRTFSEALARTEQRDPETDTVIPLRSMPNSFLPPVTNATPGLMYLGDALNMRHPLTGGGMTVAFNDVVLLSELLSPERIPSLTDTRTVLKTMKSFHWRRKGLSSVINILAQALYSLFAADDPQLQALQLGCFRYFQLGGNCVDGPVGLLAGIIRQPFVLFFHFFSVALYAIWIYVFEGQRPMSGSKAKQSLLLSSPLFIPVRFLLSVQLFWKACVVIFPYIFAELRR
ncbi:MAG: Squalene epoxidase [Chrysothrix sp. TS-e1954]|nr:MAG: Squalene epoxidase [Chrysothrix sp. TS-e1954]